MFRVGIVGCGNISGVHAKVLAALEETELVACADIVRERAERMAASYGCRAYADYEEMLEAERLDAVHLCTPHGLHPAMALAAAKRGIAVFTEKPPAIDRKGWEMIREAAGLVPVGICFQNRYHGNVIRMQELAASGDFGALRGIRAFVTWCRTADYYPAGGWKGTWATEGGGALINQAVHTLDLMLRFLGVPDQVEAHLANHHLRGVIEVEDTAEIYMRSGDKTALLYASTAYSADAPVIIELDLEGAVLRLEGDGLEIRRGGKAESVDCGGDIALGKSYWGVGHKACISDFYASIREGRPFANDPASCEVTMETLLSVYERRKI